MARRKQQTQDPAADEARRHRQERDAEEVQDLPNREAMSILSGFPSVPGLPIIGGNSGTPIPVDPSAPPAAHDPSVTPADPSAADPSASPTDLNTISPTNNVSSSNVGSAGTTEATGAVQDAPIVQR